MYRATDPYAPAETPDDDAAAMNELQRASERAIDDTLGGRGVAPMAEMCDPSEPGCHPGKLGVEDDLGLAPAGEAEPEEHGISLIESVIADAGDEFANDGVEAELGETSEETLLGEVDLVGGIEEDLL